MIGSNRTSLTPEMNWRFDPERGGGAIYDLGCYCINHARFIFGMEPTTVMAVGDFHEPCGIDFQVAATLGFPGGRSAQLSFGFGLGGSQEIHLTGTAGWLKADAVWNNEDRPTGIEGRFVGGEQAKVRFPPVDQFTLQLRHMVDVIEGRAQHRIAPRDGFGQMRVMDAVRQSLRIGELVRLDQEG